MFEINEDKTINITRGDIGAFTVDVLNEAGEKYLFQKGDVVRIKVTEKKACENVMFQKDFVVEEETEQVEILLTEEETKIGEVISKPTDYWYEIELNPLTNPQTIIGYDEEGAKIFKLFPEGKDIEPVEPTPEDIPVVDEELDITSERPVQNQAITRAMLNLQEEIERVEDTKNITSEDLEPLAVGIEENKGNIAKNTGNIEDLLAHAKNTSNPHNVTANQVSIDNSASGLSANNVQGAIDELKGTIGYTSKNLIKYPYYRTTRTENGVTFTDNGDGSITINGTSTGVTYFQFSHRLNGPQTLNKGSYIISGVPQQAKGLYTLNVAKNDTVASSSASIILATDTSNGAEFTLDSDTDVGIYIEVPSGVKLNNVTVYPMLIYASIKDDTYEPYEEDVQTQLDKLGNIEYKKLTRTLGSTSNTQPWLEFKAQLSEFEVGKTYLGYLEAGGVWTYIGAKGSDTFCHFIAMRYDKIYYIYQFSGTWSYMPISGTVNNF